MRVTVAMALVMFAFALVAGTSAQYDYGGADMSPEHAPSLLPGDYDGEDYENHLREDYGGRDGRYFGDGRDFDEENDEDLVFERGDGGRELYMDNPYDNDADN